MKCKNWPIGVCSWSLRTDIAGVADAMKQLSLEHIHLAVRSACGKSGTKYLEAVQGQKWIITSTMIDFPQEDYSTLETIKTTGGIVPDDCWRKNKKLFIAAAQVTAKLGVKFLSMHAGFIDETDPAHARKLHNRIRTLADTAGENNITLLLETGQETAEELRNFLEKLNHPSVGVNFDPANMILYNKGDPTEAVRVLAPWVKHLHVKDAIRTEKPGTWGTEVPWGKGQVGIEKFLILLQEIRFNGAMAIEREAGDNRFGDIKIAVERLYAFSR
jgi:hypothetical protein